MGKDQSRLSKQSPELRKGKMQTKYKYIHFETENKDIWTCLTKDDYILAEIYFHKQWKEFTVIFNQRATFNAGCLNDIVHFVGQLNRKENK